MGELVHDLDGRALPKNLAERIAETRALLQGHFLLQSNRHCEYFLRSAQLLYRRPDGELFANALLPRLANLAGHKIVAAQSASSFLAEPLARMQGVDLALLRVDETKRPTKTLSSGAMRRGEDVVVVVDHVTTGSTSTFDRVASAVTEQYGARVLGGVALSVHGSSWLSPSRVSLMRVDWSTPEPAACSSCRENAALWAWYEFA